MAGGQAKIYGILIAMLVIAFVIVVLRSALVGVTWNPLGFIPKTRLGRELPEIAQAISGIIIVVGGIAATIWVYRRTKPK